jgi:PleD family two-component response regulator
LSVWQAAVTNRTASRGLAEFKVDESAEELLRRADEALYVAKGQGRIVSYLQKVQKLVETLKPFKRA